MTVLANTLIPETRIGGLMTAGFLVLGIGFGGMTAWAALAPLHSAVMAPGVLVPESGRKTIKHTTGGIIGEIMVREGATVTAGQVLLRLDATEADARLEVLSASWNDALAAHARLTAELLEKPEIAWPEALADKAATSAAAKSMENQKALFSVRRSQREAATALIRERILSLNAEGKSLDEQRRFLGAEKALIEQEIGMFQSLLARGNSPKTKLLDLRKEESRLQARDRELAARVAETGQKVTEAEAEIVARQEELREKVVTDLDKARSEVARLSEEIRDAANQLAHRDIKAPEDGTVVGLGHLAIGGVITPGEAILDIVPGEQTLLAETRLQPQDIEAVSVGMPARVTLTAYDTRTIGTLEGTVDYVSADRLTDPATHQPYYLTRIRLAGGNAHEVHNFRILPGMPVEAKILIQARTPLDYIISPITRSYDKAFIGQ